MKSRFEQELSGDLGEFWVNHAKKELEEVRNEFNNGEITIDENGVARNKIGRSLMNDMIEKLLYITTDFDVEATRAARDAEVSAAIEEYRRNQPAQPSEEEREEMIAAFGYGVKVVDVLTGRVVQL